MSDREFMVKWSAGQLLIHASSIEEARSVIIEYISSEKKNLMEVQEVEAVEAIEEVTSVKS